MGYTLCDPETAASEYCLDYGRAVARIEARYKTCAICRNDFDPQDGGKQIWMFARSRYRYICPECWENADEIEEEEEYV